MMKNVAVLAFCVIVVTALLVSVSSAIPESDLNKFRAAGRYYVTFSEYTNASQVQIIRSFHNESDSFYIVFRANIGDVPPYDDFYVDYQCLGDGMSTQFHTTDYPSWMSSGFINFKKSYGSSSLDTYDSTSLNSAYSYCWINSASGLDANGNAGYTGFYVELVPVLTSTVITVDAFCTDAARRELISNLTSGISNVVGINVNFVYTLSIVFQILAVIFVVLGIPIFIIMLIRWAIWRVSGYKMFARNPNG